MKKSILFMVAALGLLTACDPSKDDISMPGNSKLTGEQLAEGFQVVQYADEEYTTEAADGNYFTFTTSPARVVTVYQLDEEGSRNELSAGSANGKFKIVPKRGNPTEQVYYVETKDFNGNTITATKTATVFVPSELSPEMRLLASDAYGSKTWTWDTEFREDGGTWGNVGYAAGEDWTSGIWFACPPADLTGQLQHSNTGVATGEEDPNATMVISDDGNVLCFDAGGNQIRKGKILGIEGYTGECDKASIDGSQANWSYGTLKTTEGAILFPFKINGGGYMPTEFEVKKLDANHLQLIYVAPGTGSWSEATWWAFKSNSDPEGMLTEFGTKAWTWDTEFREDGGTWGNVGYAAGEDWTSGIWFACPPADLTGQLQHSDTGVANGEEDPDAYMTFDWKTGTIKSFNAAGTEIRSGKFEIPAWYNGAKGQASIDGSQANWAYGTLATDPGSILFPFKINGGGTKVGEFEIIDISSDKLKLIYVAPGTGSWSEATWWAFKKK
ncbi:MAG: hypothetical protein K6A98_01565 [Prevotella sp.]|nr:hypothetical protein [Prevotella sp.]